jgi:hypothetical protein
MQELAQPGGLCIEGLKEVATLLRLVLRLPASERFC